MQFFEIQQLVEANAQRYAKKHGIELTHDYLLLKLMEETGEFAQAVSVCRNQCREEKKLPPEEARDQLASELADVLNIVLLLAHKFDVDLLDALDKKTLQKGRRYLELET